MQARLKVLHDKANVKQVKLLPVTLIGRSTECNLKIASSQVSRVHCRITLGDDTVFVEDLGSANGTLLDGQPLPPHQPMSIAPGTRIIIGPAEFQIDYVAPTSSTMVLPRSGVPPIPEMPSTEMIFPVTAITQQFATPPIAALPVQPSADFVVQSTVVPPMNIPATTAAAAVPVAAPVAVPGIPAEPVPAETTAVAGSGVPPSDDEATFVMPPATTDDTVLLDAPLDFAANLPNSNPADEFGFSDQTIDEATEATQFMFTESIPDSYAAKESNPAPPADPSPKSGGLKSLFSMFGRKEKRVAGAAPATSVATQAAAPPPSVFLPTMDVVQSPLPATSHPAESFKLEDTATVPAESAETVVIEEESPSENSTEEDDGFQQFLSQL